MGLPIVLSCSGLWPEAGGLRTGQGERPQTSSWFSPLRLPLALKVQQNLGPGCGNSTDRSLSPFVVSDAGGGRHTDAVLRPLLQLCVHGLRARAAHSSRLLQETPGRAAPGDRPSFLRCFAICET